MRIALSSRENPGMDPYILDLAKVRDILGMLLDEQRCLRVVPARILEGTTPQERLLFGVRHGVYSFPTVDLCSFLRSHIRGRRAIEIGSGHGALARALAIPATDNRQQEDEGMKAHYAALRQPTVPYGEHVEKLDATAAVEKYRPDVVIGCWVTHRFDPGRPHAGGSTSGVDEAAIIAACDEYIFVGNEHVHAHKPIWSLPHEKLTPPWLYSRAVNGSRDFIGIWRREH